VEELKQLNETKNRFLSNITHELRTPLCVIINACDFLKGGYGGSLNEKQYRYVDNASECGSHLLTLINDLLDLTRLRSGKTTAVFSEFTIHKFVENIVNEMQNFRPDAHIDMLLRFSPDDFTVTADPQMLRQIIYNLLSNALKFSPPNSQITITVQQLMDSRQMRLSICDQGIGIAPENIERVFKEFEQIENPLTKKQSGTGLGLPIVKKLVELHHGNISLRSMEGKGTEAILLLPLEQETASPVDNTVPGRV
ncbi:MAG: HAMP domain-containing histidine kinase, partial [Acidaminococcaceae bacterium]|nr:HAMP domain-containing histidine kinase [Acidaminococcaceae bacterium]